MLDPEKLKLENPPFGKEEVKSLCLLMLMFTMSYLLVCLNKQVTHLAYIEFKASWKRSIPEQLNKLLVAVDTLSPSNADCERGFSAMNNIITDISNMISTSNAEEQLFFSTVGLPSEKWCPEPYMRSWLGKREKQLTPLGALLVETQKRIIAMNLCGKYLNNFLIFKVFFSIFILFSRESHEDDYNELV